MASDKEIKNLANLIRIDSLKMTSLAGSGHPTSCLSCAEILSVLFFNEMSYDIKNAFNPDNDEFILSKGHAVPAVYSSLYRAGCIPNPVGRLRKITSAFEGHPVPNSLRWLKVATGSLGQGLGVGVGMALSAKIRNKTFRTFVLMGDSEMAEGSVYEAMQIASYYKLNNLIAIIDVNRLGQNGETMYGHNLSNYKNKFISFGWEVLVVDGHNVRDLVDAFRKTRFSKKPMVIIAKTFKGKGVSFLEDKDNWHGRALNKDELDLALSEIKTFKPAKFSVLKPQKSVYKKSVLNLKDRDYLIGDMVSTREAYGETISRLNDSETIVLDSEVGNSTMANKSKSVDGRFIECFISEQNMISMALGLSIKGHKVFASTFSAFLTRAHDQIRMAGISKTKNLVICGSHSGVSIGEDGVSQMGLEDIGMFRNIYGCKIFCPSDAVSTKKLIKNFSNSMVYLRTIREKTPVIYKEDEAFKEGDFKVLYSSKKDKLVVAASGITVHEAIKAYNKSNKVNFALVDIYSVNPFNSEKFLKFVKSHGNKLLVVEDHYSCGGIGEMMASVVAGKNVTFKSLSVRKLPHSGKPSELLKDQGIDSDSILNEIKKF